MQCTNAQRMRLTSSKSQMHSQHQDGTLVVVDMQTFFVKGCLNPRLVANVMKEVLAAKTQGAGL